MSEQPFYDWMNAQKAQAEASAAQQTNPSLSQGHKSEAKIWEHLLVLANERAKLTYLQQKTVKRQVERLSCISSVHDLMPGVFILATYINSVR